MALRCRPKAKVKLGPTGSFGRDALRRVLAIRTTMRSRLSPAIVPLLPPDELW